MQNIRYLITSESTHPQISVHIAYRIILYQPFSFVFKYHCTQLRVVCFNRHKRTGVFHVTFLELGMVTARLGVVTVWSQHVLAWSQHTLVWSQHALACSQHAFAWSQHAWGWMDANFVFGKSFWHTRTSEACWLLVLNLAPSIIRHF